MLTPSERVLLITEIARRLQVEEWVVIDLTLRQFGLPTRDEWTGSEHAYIIAMIESADPGTIISLANHLGFDFHKPSALAPTFWDQGFFRLFLSHLAAHRVEAADLQSALRARGISAFVAHNDIEPTKEWQDEIELALTTCDALAAMLHPAFHASNWTDQEMGIAIGRGVLIVSIRYGQDPYGFIGRYQALQGSGRPSSSIADDLLDILTLNKLTAARMAEGLVTLFERSDSYQQAKHRVKLLDKIQDWTPALFERINLAAKQNDQIYNASGVLSRVQMIISTRAAG